MGAFGSEGWSESGSITCGQCFIGWVGTLEKDENPDRSYRLGGLSLVVQMRVI